MDNEISNIPNKRAIKILSAGHLVSDAYGGFVVPIMPLIAAKLEISLGMVGILYTISSLSSSITQPLFGYISDLSSKRLFVIGGILASSLFISLIGLPNDYWLVALFFFLGSMGVGLFHPQATSLTGYYSGKEINNYMGIFIACGTIGYALGPSLSSMVVQTFGLHSTILAIIPGIIVASLMYKKLPKIPADVMAKRERGSFKDILSFDKVIFNLSFISIIRALAAVSFVTYIPFLLKEYNYSLGQIGVLITLFSLCGGIASYFGGKWSNKIGKKPIMLFSLLPAAPTLIGSLYFLDKIPMFAFVLFVLSGLLLMSSTSVNIVIAQKAAPKHLGMVSGLIGGFSFGIAGILQSPIGFLATNYGIKPVLMAIAFTPLLGALSTIFISKKYA